MLQMHEWTTWLSFSFGLLQSPERRSKYGEPAKSTAQSSLEVFLINNKCVAADQVGEYRESTTRISNLLSGTNRRAWGDAKYEKVAPTSGGNLPTDH
jgi:hypothetical protein